MGTINIVTATPQQKADIRDALDISEEVNIDNYAAVWVDDNDRIAFAIKSTGELEGQWPASLGATAVTAEVTAARGARADLNTRLNVSISDYGYPTSYVVNEHALRETRYRLRRLAWGDTTQLVIGAIGDSWTHNTARWSSTTGRQLIATYGDAGIGYVGLGFLATGPFSGTQPLFWNGSGRVTNFTGTAAVTATYTGAWTSQYAAAPFPDAANAISTTAGDTIVLSIPAGQPVSGVRLYFNGATGRSLNYQWNGGAATSLSMDTAGVQSVLLSGFPTNGAAFTLTLTVAGTGVQLGGVEFLSTTSGVRFNKLACTGSSANQWAALNAADFRSSIQTLAPHLVTIMHGTNDQTSSRSKATFKGNVQTIINNVRAAVPNADILLIAPSEGGRTYMGTPVNDISNTIDVTSGSLTLTSGQASGARLIFTGTPGSALTVTIPAGATTAVTAGRPALAPRGLARYIITNNSTQSVTIAQTGSTGTVVIAAGGSAVVAAGGDASGAQALTVCATSLPTVMTVPMSDYQSALAELAIENDCAFLNLQHVFGNSYIDYAAGGLRPLFVADLVHPDPNIGGRAISDAILRLLTTI